MPPLTVRVQPSVRIRRTSPLTVTRLPMITVPCTTYQVVVPLVPHPVSLLVTSVALGLVFNVPSASRYVTLPSANATVGRSAMSRQTVSRMLNIRFFIKFSS